MSRVALVAALALVVAGAPLAARPRSHLVLTGALNTSSARQQGFDSDSCTYRPRVQLEGLRASRQHVLSFSAGPMALGHGPSVARVGFDLANFHGPGRYGVRRPVTDFHRTPLHVVTARSATTGVGSRWYQAAIGGVRVVVARNIGLAGRSGYASGSVDALLGDRGRMVHLRGAWRCTIAPEANGG